MTREPSNSQRMRWLVFVFIVAVIAATTPGRGQPTGTLKRVRDTGRIRLGYRVDERPFSFRDATGSATGYSVALCRRIAEAVKVEPKLPALTIDWVPITTTSDRLSAVQQGAVDMLCDADTVTIERRSQVAFSTPIFPGGIGALLRPDAPVRLREVLSGRGQTFHPTWRASASQIVQSRAFSAVSGTTAEKWLRERINELLVTTTISPVNSYDAGLEAVLGRRVDVLFGERAILLDMARRHSPSGELVVLDRLFTYEPLALALASNDERFRLFVDRELAQLHASHELERIYASWFGEPDSSTLSFFQWNALPE
jgi:ABC-type amino acid transport substrate-binding protein